MVETCLYSKKALELIFGNQMCFRCNKSLKQAWYLKDKMKLIFLCDSCYLSIPDKEVAILFGKKETVKELKK